MRILLLGVAHTPHLYSSTIHQTFVPLWFCMSWIRAAAAHPDSLFILTETTQCLVHCRHASLSLPPYMIAMDEVTCFVNVSPSVLEGSKGTLLSLLYPSTLYTKPKYRVLIWLQIRLLTMAIK